MTDTPETGPDNDATASTSESAPRPRRRGVRFGISLLFVILFATLVSLVFHTAWFTTFAAVTLGLVIMRTGWFFLQQFATPPPPPPDRGTLRRVRLVFRCNICGAEVRMTVANDEDPEPPRHCMDDMQLITPLE